ncbi:TSC2 [Bugula neritina]|uniref:TSC2 n=1 Tax=Bugula neritina TaxID=10212 RepID=A0A7J7KGC1_BUGNE|nr:TSC2 [Bugula neritina]
MKYFYIKSAALLPLCMTLSRTVLIEPFVQSSWKLMKELLGTHLGYSALSTLTNILHNRQNQSDGSLLRGAVFFIGMALWGSQRVNTLQVSATAVLPAFKIALASNNTKTAYEISLTVLRLVRKFGKAQPYILWENVLDILDSLYLHIKNGSVGESQILDKISNNLHDIVTAIEELQDTCTYCGPADRLFNFIEMCAASRPESSVTMLLEHRSRACRPNEDNWLTNLDHLLTKYYRTESRSSIRLKALSTFNQIIITNKILYEEELLELLLSTCSAVYSDPDVTVRCKVVQLLVERAKCCTSRKCGEIISLLQKIADRETKPNIRTSTRTPDIEHKCSDILEAITGLVDIFKIKLYEPRGSQAVLPLEVIVGHINRHYAANQPSAMNSQIRKLIFTLFLDLRADWSGKVGLEAQGYSSYVYIADSYIRGGQSGEDVSAVDFKVLSFSSILRAINICLSKETDWGVLSVVLKMMPKQWQNKRLVLSAGDSAVDEVCVTLCSMLKEKEGRNMYNTPTTHRFNKSDFDEQIFPLLTCMSAYHSSLRTSKGDLIKCLEFGLLTKSGCICLVRLPKLYRNFNADQYRFIFGIALPYTDPSQFQHFAVYLAYHVIVMWFVKCRLRYRKQFVQLIIKSLQTHTKNIRESQISAHADQCSENEKVAMFHQELQETCIDILSRYTFSNCASVPKRTPVTKFLLEGGRSQSWFVGNKLVTITTSGGGAKVTKTGLCERCTSSVRGTSVTPAQTPTEGGYDTLSRKRHKSAYVRPSSDPVTIPQIFPQDDIMIHNKQDVTSQDGVPHAEAGDTPAMADDLLNAAARQRSGGHFQLGECNCWCNGWAEIYLHRPSGDTSWILRIQNKQLFNYEDFPFSDISSLFMASPHKSPFPSSIGFSAPPPKMVESKSMEESEFYEEQKEKHFNDLISSSTAKRRLSLLHYSEEGIEETSIKPTPLLHRTFSSPTKSSANPEVTLSPTHTAPTHTTSTPSIDGSTTPTAGNTSHVNGAGSTPVRSQRNFSPLTVSPHSSFSSPQHIGSRGSAFTTRQKNAGSEDDNNTEMVPFLKPRSQTFSYSTTSTLPDVRVNTPAAKDTRAGILPNFVFLQLYHMGILHVNSVPIPIPEGNEEFNRGLKNLERIAPYETHKVGIVYVGKGQASNEAAILSNTYGSQRYSQFLKKLGTLISLDKCDPRDMYVGGLDHEQGADGKYTYIWHDEVVQMVFHIATMMPSKESDARCTNKKLHIGNNYVTIVYNESGEPYSLGTIKGKFNYVNIIIEPLDQVSNAVTIQCKDDVKQILEHVSTTKVISDENITDLVKQIALHSSMASLICERLKHNVFYASNWLERLRQIRRMKDKVPVNRKLNEKLSQRSGEKSVKERAINADFDSSWVTDFTEYC